MTDDTRGDDSCMKFISLTKEERNNLAFLVLAEASRACLPQDVVFWTGVARKLTDDDALLRIANDYEKAGADEMKEQPAPKQGRDDVTTALTNLIQERAEQGERKYGRRLQTFNGRSAIRDALEEAIDQSAYLMQAYLEEQRKGEVLAEAITALEAAHSLLDGAMKRGGVDNKLIFIIAHQIIEATDLLRSMRQ